MEFVLCKEKKIWQKLLALQANQLNGSDETWRNVTKPEKIDFHNFQSHGREAATGQKIAPWHPDWENSAYLKQAGKVDIILIGTQVLREDKKCLFFQDCALF